MPVEHPHVVVGDAVPANSASGLTENGGVVGDSVELHRLALEGETRARASRGPVMR